jgi:hypothetical protein
VTAPGDDQDDILAVSLASGMTWRAAALAAAVSESTIARRVADPVFAERVRAFRRATVERALSLLTTRLVDAVEQLHLVATSGANEGNRVRASIALLDLAVKFQRHYDLDEAMRRTEAEVAEIKHLLGLPDEELDEFKKAWIKQYEQQKQVQKDIASGHGVGAPGREAGGCSDAGR